MSLMLIAALQVAAPAAPSAPVPMLRTDFDLADVQLAERGALSLNPDRGCSRSSADEILVCGRRPTRDDYPLEAMSRLFAPRPIVAEMSLGGGATGRAYVDQVTLDRGAVSNRIMFGITLTF
jgi:hypothetical protein